MINHIQGRLGLLFTAFFLLVSVSVGFTFWGIEAQKGDALVINLAGRQRMLVQQMSRLALQIEQRRSQSDVQALGEAIETFDQTLLAIRAGGQAPYLPGLSVEIRPAGDSELAAELDLLAGTWDRFRAALYVILESSPGDPAHEEALQTIEQLRPEIGSRSDNVVRWYENASRLKINRLRWMQGGFFVAALALLGLGALLTRSSVIRPVKDLIASAERIGQGDLDTPVQAGGPVEVHSLADAFETARVQLKDARAEQLAWTNQLEARVAQRTQELEALYQVSREISSRLDVQHVLHSVTEKARQLLGVEGAYICLLDEDRQFLNLQATSAPPEAVRRTVSPVVSSLPQRVLAGECALPCGAEHCQGACGIVEPRFRVSHLAAPLRMEERVIGALCVGSPRAGVFSSEAGNLLTRLANSAAVALQNARLYAQAERLAILEERQRIAADMHDGLAQTLNYLRLAGEQVYEQVEGDQRDQALETLERLQRAMDQAERETRQAIASLQEDFPLYYTLQEQLANLAAEFSSPSTEVTWSSSISIPLVMPHQETEQVLRVAREALQNVCHHAQARRIALRLDQVDGMATVEVQDDGSGFDPLSPQANDGRQHFGLKIMQARAARLGGSLEVQSSPREGTCVRLTWPVEVES